MTSNETPPPLKRVDAQRNRDKILATARAAFANSDTEISMAEISRRAGVGMATLYRNFPDRRQLLETLYTDEVDALCDAAHDLGVESAGTTFVNWLHEFFAFLNSKHHLASELLKHSEAGMSPFFSDSRERVLAAGRPLLAAAQSSGVIRDDVVLEQVLDLVSAIARISGDARYLDPMLQTVIDGLLTPRG